MLFWCPGVSFTANLLHIPQFHLAQKIVLNLSQVLLAKFKNMCKIFKSNGFQIGVIYPSFGTPVNHTNTISLLLHNIISLSLANNLKHSCTLPVNLAVYTSNKYYTRPKYFQIQLHVIKYLL